jgi:hypothetical protein
MSHRGRVLITLVCASLVSCAGSQPGTGSPDAGAGEHEGPEDGGPADAGPADAGPADAGQTGTPIVAPMNTWTWVPFSNAFCGNGATVGIGVNPAGAANAPVLLYLEGGGACWNDITCYGAKTAAYFTTGYTEADFTSESTNTSYLALSGGFFDRSASANPFKDFNYVYVPYCTGDVHAGNNTVAYASGTANFVGYANMKAYLERLVPTFAGTPHVFLAGSSAGGFGAVANWPQTQAAFGSIPVDVIDDSGTFIPPDIEADGTGEAPIREAWNLGPNLPPDCSQCSTRLDAMFGYIASAHPTVRLSLLTYQQDSVLPQFFSITTAEFEMGLSEEITTWFTPSSNLQYFEDSGSGHVLFFSPTLSQSGTTVQQFLTAMVSGSSGWTSVH